MTNTRAAAVNQVVENEEEQETEEDSDPFLTLIQRGDLLRKLRELEVQDEAERQQQQQQQLLLADSCTALGDSTPTNDVVALEHGVTLLRYESFLNSQRYYDDYKHVDYKYIDYSMPALQLPTTTTTVTPSESFYPDVEGTLFQNYLIVEQDKTLGKGGFCWDCAHILGDFIIQKHQAMPLEFAGKTIIELGTGTGLCGLMIAKAVDVHVSVTDLPQLLPLLQRNVMRNFDASCIVDRNQVFGESKMKNGDNGMGGEDLFDAHDVDNGILADYQQTVLGCCKPSDFKQSKGRISCFSLDWDEVTKSSSSSTPCHQTFDVVLGAELVASLYDPIALAHTIHALTHDQSTVYIGMKDRLDTVNRQFEAAMRDLFVDVETNIRPATRNRNPYTWILIAKQRKAVQ